MTKKLLLPTRLKRMQIRQQEALGGPPERDLNTVRDHNQQCERSENSSRLENWIEDQRTLLQQQPPLLETNCEATNLGHLPTTLPLDPALPPYLSETSSQTSPEAATFSPDLQRQALLRQIREKGIERAIGTIMRERFAANGVLNAAQTLEAPAEPSRPLEDLAPIGLLDGSEPLPDVDVPPYEHGDVDEDLPPTNTGVTLEGSANTYTRHALAPPLDSQTQHAKSTARKHAPPVPPKPKFNLYHSQRDSSDLEDKDSESSSRPQPEPEKTKNSVIRSPNTLLYPHILSTPTQLEPPKCPLRTFTSNCGRFHVEARLLDWKMAKVELLKTNGIKIAVPLSRFSGGDVEYVLREMMRRAEERDGFSRPEGEGGCGGDREGDGCGQSWREEGRLREELEGVYSMQA